VRITPTRVVVGLKGAASPYLAHDLARPANADDSVWTLEDAAAVASGSSEATCKELRVSLTKRIPGEPWTALFAGHEAPGAGTDADPDRRRLLLQRFQEENPGFDFSGAVVTGSVPDAHTFMR